MIDRCLRNDRPHSLRRRREHNKPRRENKKRLVALIRHCGDVLSFNKLEARNRNSLFKNWDLHRKRDRIEIGSPIGKEGRRIGIENLTESELTVKSEPTLKTRQVLWTFQDRKMELKGSQSNSVATIEFGLVCDCRDRKIGVVSIVNGLNNHSEVDEPLALFFYVPVAVPHFDKNVATSSMSTHATMSTLLVMQHNHEDSSTALGCDTEMGWLDHGNNTPSKNKGVEVTLPLLHFVQ
ncbi:hypothetical protein EVAR_84132_1 [Eumeta japonica]|uniref:Uncharacterized protein n=1 Tax=Eumeta variegata TaxID=151549 RepID=A0A4C1V0A2_EUMVA|nr:hypothetical protein EVAR_84132_1 [Eumeta japonica]